MLTKKLPLLVNSWKQAHSLLFSFPLLSLALILFSFSSFTLSGFVSAFSAINCKMSWDEYVKNCKQAVTHRQQQYQQPPQLDDGARTLPLQLPLQSFRLPGPSLDDPVSLFLPSRYSNLRCFTAQRAFRRFRLYISRLSCYAC